VEIVGEATADRDFQELAGQDLRQGELAFGLPAALLVLLLVFGSLVAGPVPLLLAIMSIVVAIALASLVGQSFALSVFVVNMITGMGLALGIDYSLFILSRFREERAAGREAAEAIGTAGATASRSVLFSGLAFALAMVGMVLVPDTILRSLAVGAIIVGVVSVVAPSRCSRHCWGCWATASTPSACRSWGAASAMAAGSREASGRGWSKRWSTGRSAAWCSRRGCCSRWRCPSWTWSVALPGSVPCLTGSRPSRGCWRWRRRSRAPPPNQPGW
jgi:hypothetical protein